MKKALLLGLVIVLMAPAAWAAGETPKKGGNLTICVADEPPGLDPTASASAAIDRVVYASTIADALRYGQFDDQPIYEDLAKSIAERLTPAAQCLRDEMLELWRRYEAKPDRIRY